MSGRRRGWLRPYVGWCCNWSSGADWGFPKAYVMFRGYDKYFATWREAIDYASALGKRVQQLEGAS